MEHDPEMAVSLSQSITACKSKKSLGLLAEVALYRHYEEQQQITEDNESDRLISPPKTKIISRFFSLKQIRKFSEKKLLNTFAEYKKDLKRKYFCYKCQLLPHECQLKFECLNVENDLDVKKAIVNHLLEHVCNLESSLPNIKISSTKKVKIRKQKAAKISSEKDEKSEYLDHAYVQKPIVESSRPLLSEPKNKIISDNENKNNEEPALIREQLVDNLLDVQSTTTTNLPSIKIDTTTPNMRELALDYIDDIRKKSSSAAKSIIVNGDKSVIYQCKICPDKQFTSTNGLIFHYKKHAGLKPYVCERCHATFTRQHSLNYHMLIHLNKSRFVCSECSRHFRHPSHFKEHMRRHTGETPFQCSDCLIRFKTRNTYKRHLQTKHSKILTSKGIIELSNQVPYQSVPKATTNTVSMSVQSGTPLVVKPRRKYGIRFLHKNIETISKYETQTSTPTTTLISASDVNNEGTINLIAGGNGTVAAQTQPGSNITILSIPAQMPTTVHILDGGIGGGSTANTATFDRITKPLTELNPHHHQGAITLLSYQPATLFNTNASNNTGTLFESIDGRLQQMEPLIQTASSPPPLDSRTTLTELTPIVIAPPPPNYQANISAAMNSSISSEQPQPTTNDNFMRLLEAIEMTEVVNI